MFSGKALSVFITTKVSLHCRLCKCNSTFCRVFLSFFNVAKGFLHQGKDSSTTSVVLGLARPLALFFPFKSVPHCWFGHSSSFCYLSNYYFFFGTIMYSFACIKTLNMLSVYVPLVPNVGLIFYQLEIFYLNNLPRNRVNETETAASPLSSYFFIIQLPSFWKW